MSRHVTSRHHNITPVQCWRASRSRTSCKRRRRRCFVGRQHAPSVLFTSRLVTSRHVTSRHRVTSVQWATHWHVAGAGEGVVRRQDAPLVLFRRQDLLRQLWRVHHPPAAVVQRHATRLVLTRVGEQYVIRHHRDVSEALRCPRVPYVESHLQLTGFTGWVRTTGQWSENT